MTDPQDQTNLQFVPWTDVRSSTPAEPPWVLSGYIARGAVTLLAGKPKAGKSTLACAIAEAVDSGAASFLGLGVAAGAVVYLSEEGPATLAPKLPASSQSTALTREGAWPKPPWPELLQAAAAEGTRIGAVLLVIDALAFWASFAEGGEKDAGTAQATMDALGAATAAGLGVLLVHHQRKAGGEDGDAVRGSGAIFGAVDVLIELERLGEDSPAGQRRLVAVGRWPSAPPVLVVDRDAETATWRVIGQAATRQDAAGLGKRERVLAALPEEGPGVTEPELAELVGGLDKRKLGIRELFREGLVARNGGGKKGDPYRYKRCPEKVSQGRDTNDGEKVSFPFREDTFTTGSVSVPTDTKDTLSPRGGTPRPTLPPCRYPAHRASDWLGDGGRRICGVCHPPAKGILSEQVWTPVPSGGGE